MDNPNVILTPQGDAIVLSTISFVGDVCDDSGHDNANWNCCYFRVYYGPKATEYVFAYPYKKYTDTKEVLTAKVRNIRNELLKMLNNGIDAKEINAGINLKKDVK